MARRRVGAATVVAFVMLWLVPHASVTALGAPVGTAITAVPINTYAPDTIVASRSGSLDFVNLDLNRHDVVADIEDADHGIRTDHVRPDVSAHWCQWYDPGTCPLFWTNLIGAGTSVSVEGLADAVPGATYNFYCTIHPYMKGQLVVVD